MRYDASVPPLTIARSIRCAAARDGSKAAIISQERRITYADLRRRIDALSAIASDRFQLGHGSRVALISRDTPEYFEQVAGISDCGASLVTLNPRLSSGEVGRVLADCKPNLVLVDPDLTPLYATIAEAGWAVYPARGVEYEDLLATGDGKPFSPRAQSEDCFVICYTSGTTGAPKGVMLSHRSRVLTIHAMAAEYGCFGPDDHFLALTPLCHGAGFAFAAAPLLFGGTVELGQGLRGLDILERLGRGDVSGVFIVPTHAKRFADTGPAGKQAVIGHRLRSLISNAAAMPQSLKEKMVNLFGEGVYHETYGSTEAGIVTNMRPQYQLLKSNCVGTPFPSVEVEIRDADGNRLDGPGIGELFSRGPYTFSGYHGRDGETDKALQAGWVTVGDIARRDEDGFIYIVDRKSDMIITGGLNVYPKEIEEVVLRDRRVLDAAAVGLPDPEWGEIVTLFYVSADDEDLSEDIWRACEDALTPFKRPKRMIRVPELPRSAAGKLQRRSLLSMAGGDSADADRPLPAREPGRLIDD